MRIRFFHRMLQIQGKTLDRIFYCNQYVYDEEDFINKVIQNNKQYFKRVLQDQDFYADFEERQFLKLFFQRAFDENLFKNLQKNIFLGNFDTYNIQDKNCLILHKNFIILRQKNIDQKGLMLEQNLLETFLDIFNMFQLLPESKKYVKNLDAEIIDKKIYDEFELVNSFKEQQQQRLKNIESYLSTMKKQQDLIKKEGLIDFYSNPFLNLLKEMLYVQKKKQKLQRREFKYKFLTPQNKINILLEIYKIIFCNILTNTDVDKVYYQDDFCGIAKIVKNQYQNQIKQIQKLDFTCETYEKFSLLDLLQKIDINFNQYFIKNNESFKIQVKQPLRISEYFKF